MNKIAIEGIGMTSQRTRDRLTARLQQQGITNPQVLDVIRSTPRHLFLDEAMAHRAYEDVSLPIGYGQTISQPYIVARMTELLMEKSSLNRVLEIGTGSGYQTSILAQLSKRVYSVERIKALQDRARDILRLLKIYNVSCKVADGGMGWPANGPFDAILSAAAPEQVPQELLEQLDINGCLISPVGNAKKQQLLRVVRTENGFEQEIIEDVMFVPFLSGVVK